MIRTRDFLLYVVIFVFLLTGILFTVAGDLGPQPVVNEQDSVSMIDGETLSAHQSGDDLDRQNRIETLKKKLAAGEGEIIQGPPVLSSVDIPSEEELTDTLDGEIEIVTDRSVQYCPGIIENPIVFTWNAANAALETLEGARIVRMSEINKVKVGTSTVATTSFKTVLQLSMNPRLSYTPACLSSRFVGVALDGSLIENNETWRFRNISEKSIVGYARDGNPIYGPGVDESKLDRCGGMRTTEGYRYHIRERELFVLGCYVSTPAPFIE